MTGNHNDIEIDPNNAYSGWSWTDNGLSVCERRGGTTNPWG